MVSKFRLNNRILNIRWHLNCVRRICVAALIFLAFSEDAWAQNASSYTVAGIEVDWTADTAANARRQAIIQAHGRALDLLLTRLVPADQRAFLPNPDHADIVPMVQSFRVDRERTSDIRYIGTLSFQFRRLEVRQFIRMAGVNFAETTSKPVLVLPVLDFGGAKLLWDVPNPWFEAWNTLPLDNRLVPLILPVGDLVDIRNISAEQAASGSRGQIASIRERYKAATVIIVEALPDSITVPGRRNINVSFSYLGGVWEGQSGVHIFRVKDGETEAEVLKRIALEISLLIEEGWKLDNILELDSSTNLIAEIKLDELREWVEIRHRLAAIAFVKNFELATLSRGRAKIRLEYFGTIKQLQTALAQIDLTLSRGHINWVLEDSRRLDSLSTSVPDRPIKPLLPTQRDADMINESKLGSMHR